MNGPVLQGGDGLTIRVEHDGAIRIGLDGNGHDWFGPGRAGAALHEHARRVHGEPTVVDDRYGPADELVVFDGDIRCSVRVARHSGFAVLRIEAHRSLAGLATGAFDRPSVPWPVFTPADRRDGGIDGDARAVVFQACEFALPSTAKADLDGWFLLPHRPPTGWPLIVSGGDGRTIMLAPLDEFHTQTIGLGDGTLRCGWHGDLDRVPGGFRAELGVFVGDGPRACLDMWGALLRHQAGTVRPGRWADALATRPSYWTDNGAAYWYRTEPGHDVAGSIVAAVDDLRAGGVPLGSVQLDSWFYPHAVLRPFDTDEWVVPPTALVAWEERDDVLPDGIADLRRRLGDPPLVAHIRHLSSEAPIAAEVPVHVDGDYAAPKTAEPYERWLDQCVAWGVETFEHDWLVEVFFGVRGLREQPGLARAWQEGIDAAARERGITLQWCMATPADFAQTTTLTQVTSIRTCGDHGYIATPGQLWAWFCVTNAMARALGLMPFKDVFRTDPDVAGTTGEVEAVLSVLSTGPVGMGDRVGRFDRSLIDGLCRGDGVLVKPHVPIAAIGRCMLRTPGRAPELIFAECHSEHAAGQVGFEAGRVVYALAMHCTAFDGEVTDTATFAELGVSSPTGEVVVWSRTDGSIVRTDTDGELAVTLSHEGWALYTIAPVLQCGIAVFGDLALYASAGDARVEIGEVDDGVRLVVKGAGDRVTISGWAPRSPTCDEAPLVYDDASGRWEVTVDVASRGWTSTVVTMR